MSNTDGQQNNRPNCLVQFSTILQERLERTFEILGEKIGTCPWVFLITSIVIAGALSSGSLLLKSESRTEKLWVPQGSEALVQQEWVRDTFGFGGRTGYILARPKDGSDAFTTDVLRSLLSAHNSLLAARGKANAETSKFPNTYSYSVNDNTTNPHTQAICDRRGRLCYTSTIFDVLGTYNDATLASMTRAQMLAKVNNNSNYLVYDGGRPAYSVTTGDLFGGLSRDSGGKISGAKVIRSVYRMTPATISVNNQFVDPSREGWELAANEKIRANSYSADLIVFFQEVFSEEFGGAIGGDIGLLGAGYMLLILYLSLALGKRDYVHSMVGMAIVAVMVVGLSVGGAYGMAGFFGVINTPLSTSLPFLILGLGVDDAFIIAGEFQAVGTAHPDLDKKQRMSETLKHAGVSILITSVTDIIAFFIGASTILPALSAFCIFAALGVMFVFVLNVTLFSAALVLDMDRTNANRMDCLCCIKLETHHPLSPEEGQELPCCLCCHKIPQHATRKLCKWVAEKLILWPVKLGVIVVSLGLLAFAIVGATRLTTDFRIEWFLPDDSPLQKYYQWNNDYFTNDLPVFGYTRKLDYPSTGIQTKMDQTHNLFTKASYLSGFTFDWHRSFVNWANTSNSTLTSATFYPLLSQYLAVGQPGHSLNNFVAWVDPAQPSKGIKGAYIFGAFKQSEVTNAENQVRSMQAIRRDMKSIFPDTNEGFAFSFVFGLWEQYVVIAEEMWRNIGLALLSVFIIATVLIPKLTASLLVLFTVCLTVADLLGLMYWWGLTIDGVTVVYLVIAIGLSVDYSAHIGEAFMLSKKKTRDERVIDTMYRMGASVFNGAFSTFLAVVAMAFARTYIFRVFFQQFFLVTLFGSVHGLVLLPVLLSTCGPEPLNTERDEKEMEAAGFTTVRSGTADIELKTQQAVVTRESEVSPKDLQTV